MFIDLFSLFQRHSHNTPLEDFTTEALASVLRAHEDVKLSICKKLLNLEGDTFSLTTQAYYPASNSIDNRSYIDLEIKSEKSICFIENKVDSSENEGQLDKYARVLNRFTHLSKHLIYCTKNLEPKKEIVKNYRDTHNYTNIQWQAFYTHLSNFTEYPIVNEFLNFLESKNMSRKMTLTATDILALQNLNRVQEWSEKIINGSDLPFRSRFGVPKKLGIRESLNQAKGHNRTCSYLDNVLLSDTGNSEILYSIDYDGFAIVQIYTSLDHVQNQQFFECATQSTNELQGFDLEILPGKGNRIVAKMNLATQINNDDVEHQMSQWFTSKFEVLVQFINSTSNDLTWSPSLLKAVSNKSSL